MDLKKVFISHSSSDKEHYVRPLVNRLLKTLGEDKLVYDELTFETGGKTIDAIRSSLDDTDLFVLLISEAALKSDWVKQEITWAEELNENYGTVQKVLPVIIDNRIRHDNEEIPDWLRAYNLKPVFSPGKLSRMILSKVKQLTWSQSRFLEEKNNLFVGRNSEMESFENRINDPMVDRTNFIIASGMYSVGRRSFLKQALQKSGIIKKSETIPIIILDGHQSIEDFIKEVANLIDDTPTPNLMELELDLKIELAKDLLLQLTCELKEKLFIDDRGAIVTHTGDIAPWFKTLVERFEELEITNVSVCILSGPRPRGIHSMRNVYHIHLDLLSYRDRIKLLNRYSLLNEMELTKSELGDMTDIFSGFPKEIFFAIDIILQEGKEYFYKNILLVSDYSDNQTQSIIELFKYSGSDEKILKIISKFNFMNLETLEAIGQYAKIDQISNEIEKYFRHGILNQIGIDGEYIALNSAVKNYFERQIHLDSEIQEAISKFVESIDLTELDIDLSDEMFIMQEKLKSGNRVPIDKMIPSYYLKTMKYLYDNRKNIEVVKFADTVLESSNILDSYIRDEIMFFLCSSLARLKQERFKYEAQYFNGFKRNFLFGFFYRQIGNYQLAIENFNKVLQVNPNYSQAKRELVLLYNKIGEYEKAFAMARDNYENNRSNPYHIQAYFQSVLNQSDDKLAPDIKKEILIRLLNDFEKLTSPSARNMYLISKAKYHMEIDKDLNKVQSVLDKALSEFGNDDTYLLLFQVDFFEKKRDIDGLINTKMQMQKEGFDKKESNYYNDFLKSIIFIDALKKNEMAWRQSLSKMTVTDNAKNNIKERAELLMS